jgi:hypothetical protein
MSVRRPTEPAAEASTTPPAEASARPQADHAPSTPALQTDARPRSRDEAEARYVTARDAWTAAMRRANSGRAADLASLAITQEAYELASAEVESWRSGRTIAIKVEPEKKRTNLDALIGQEMAWRRVHEVKVQKPGALGRLARRLTGRG